MKVFIADDSTLVAQRLKESIAELAGVELVGEAADTTAAIEAILRLKPEAVILDLRMPGGGGLPVLAAIKALEPAPLVMLLTSSAFPQHRQQCLAAGADYFFDKTTEFERVAEVLQRRLDMVKIAILADIHGNSVAFDAVLADLDGQGPVDHVLIAGDFFAPGPDPRGVLDRLRQLPQARFLRGNTDRYLLKETYATVYGPDGWQGQLRRAFDWTAGQLGPAGRRFLADLPFCRVIRVGDSRLLAVHGSPRSDEEGLTTETSRAEFEAMNFDTSLGLLACAHTHLPMDRVINGVRVINPGSVGLPFDGIPQASYALVSAGSRPQNGRTGTCPNAWRVELRRVAYDVEQAVTQFQTANHPAAEVGAFNLRTGRPLGADFAYVPAHLAA
jgi:putative phosphoesterase